MHNRLLLFSLFLILLPARSARAQQAVIPIAEAREQGVNARVTVQGVVTRAYGDFVRFQDTSGATGASALVIRKTSGPFHEAIQSSTIGAGTVLQVTGTLTEYNGLLQINEGDLTDYEVVEQGAVPDPQPITLADLATNGEAYESELVEISSLRFGPGGVFHNDNSYEVTDGTATLVFRVQGPDETRLGDHSVPRVPFTYVGVTGEFQNDFLPSDYQLIPVLPSDVRPVPGVTFDRLYAVVLEADSTLSVTVQAHHLTEGQTATLTASRGGTTEAGDASVTGFQSTFTLSTDDSTHTLTFDPIVDENEEGVERLEIVLESTEVAVAETGRFTLWLLDDSIATTTLYPDIEGSALRSRLRQDFGRPPTLGYDVARDTLYGVVFNETGIVEGFYTDYEVTLEGGDPSEDVLEDDINAEHVWPQSKGADEEPARSNMHILVPARSAVNSARSNYPYAEIPDDETDTWYVEDQTRTTLPTTNIDAYSELNSSPPRDERRFEPREVVKGNVARKVLYFRTIYPEQADLSFFGVQQATLLAWNAQDPPDTEEVRRNLIIASYQGNLPNPFVLDSTLARRAYGSTMEPVSIAEARALGVGATVTVEGIVTRAYGAYARIQDTSGIGGASALVLRQTDGALSRAFQSAIASGEIQAGTVLRVTGTLGTFNGTLQINNEALASYEIIGQAQTPTPQTITLSDLESNGEAYESELVRITDLHFPRAQGTFEHATSYDVTDGTAALVFRVQRENETSLGGAPIPADVFTYMGVTGEFEGTYQLIPIFVSDLDVAGGGGEPQVPPTVTVDVTLPFDDPDAAQSYRLVALPGAVNLPLRQTIEGAPGTDWQAYWDNGAEMNYFVKYDGSDRFYFRPGRGFWLLANDPWTVQREIETLPLTGGAVEIPLHDGWNIISNPLDQDVPWAVVEAANGGALQPIWSFDGSFREADTFASAKTGRAYYFLNNEGRDALVIPYPVTGEQPAQQHASTPPTMLTLTAYQDGRRASSIQVGMAPGARDGRDPYDHVAPPGRFVTTQLLLKASSTSQGRRQRWLAQEVRASDEGQVFDLVLRAEPGHSVILRADGLAASDKKEAVLVHVATGRRFNLRTTPEATLTPHRAEAEMRLIVGTEAFVEEHLADALPDALEVLPNHPNPFSRSTQIEYVLPEARHVRVTVYDVLGRRVAVLVDERQSAGQHTLTWNSRAGVERSLASGVYFVRVEAGSDHDVQQVVLLR